MSKTLAADAAAGPLKGLLVGKSPLQESITKKGIFVLLQTPGVSRPRLPGCQRRDAPVVWKGAPKQLG